MEILVDQLAKGLISNLSKKQLWMNKKLLYIHMRGNNTIEKKSKLLIYATTGMNLIEIMR